MKKILKILMFFVGFIIIAIGIYITIFLRSVDGVVIMFIGFLTVAISLE